MIFIFRQSNTLSISFLKRKKSHTFSFIWIYFWCFFFGFYWMTRLQKFQMFKVKCDFPPHYFHLFACWMKDQGRDRQRKLYKSNNVNVVWNITFKLYGVCLYWSWVRFSSLLLSTLSNPFEILPRMWKLCDIIISVYFRQMHIAHIN